MWQSGCDNMFNVKIREISVFIYEHASEHALW